MILILIEAPTVSREVARVTTGGVCKTPMLVPAPGRQ